MNSPSSNPVNGSSRGSVILWRDACIEILDALAPATAASHPLATHETVLDLLPGAVALTVQGPHMSLKLPVPAVLEGELPERLRVSALGLRQLLDRTEQPAVTLRLQGDRLYLESDPDTAIDAAPAPAAAERRRFEPRLLLEADGLRIGLSEALAGVPELRDDDGSAESQTLAIDATEPEWTSLRAGSREVVLHPIEAESAGVFLLPAPAARALLRLLRTRTGELRLDRDPDSAAWRMVQTSSGLTLEVGAGLAEV